MSEYICYMVTIFYDNRLVRCALKFHRDLIDEDHELYRRNFYRKKLHALLPQNVQRMGPIVEVQPIFEIEVWMKEEE